MFSGHPRVATAAPSVAIPHPDCREIAVRVSRGRARSRHSRNQIATLAQPNRDTQESRTAFATWLATVMSNTLGTMNDGFGSATTEAIAAAAARSISSVIVRC